VLYVRLADKRHTAVQSKRELTLLGIIGAVIVVIAVLGEWYVYDQALWWHNDDRDPRNFPPPG
jgi:hypothetical protein